LNLHVSYCIFSRWPDGKVLGGKFLYENFEVDIPRSIFQYDLSLHKKSIKIPIGESRGRWAPKGSAKPIFIACSDRFDELKVLEKELINRHRDGAYSENPMCLSEIEKNLVNEQRNPETRHYPRNGVVRFENGDIYEGDWVGDRHLFDGYGRYYYKDGRVYEGTWKEDKMHGEGCYRSPDGQVYTGEYHYGHRQGKGVLKFPDGSSYIGEFREGKFHGYGVFHWLDGRSYEGNWYRDMLHGHGKLILPDGSIYMGEFNKGSMHGKGSFLATIRSDFRPQQTTTAKILDQKNNGDTLLLYKGKWKKGEFRTNPKRDFLNIPKGVVSIEPIPIPDVCLPMLIWSPELQKDVPL
jgi:hypothetical protein